MKNFMYMNNYKRQPNPTSQSYKHPSSTGTYQGNSIITSSNFVKSNFIPQLSSENHKEGVSGGKGSYHHNSHMSHEAIENTRPNGLPPGSEQPQKYSNTENTVRTAKPHSHTHSHTHAQTPTQHPSYNKHSKDTELQQHHHRLSHPHPHKHTQPSPYLQSNINTINNNTHNVPHNPSNTHTNTNLSPAKPNTNTNTNTTANTNTNQNSSTNTAHQNSSSNSNTENEHLHQNQSQNLLEEETIVIHVCDENRKINKDFKCNKTILLSHMKYFQKFKTGTSSLEDLDISVHCDIQIFEWLIKYLHHPAHQSNQLDIGNVISILISADYLQMAKLVDECIRFISYKFTEVVKLPIDMNCITSKVLKKIAARTDIELLDQIKDRKDKLISKLYMKKLEMLFEDESNILYRCVYCSKLFTRAQKDWVHCHKAKIFIDFHGSVIAEHVADRTWDINKFIHFLRQQGLSWREIYWKIWAHLVSFHCVVCDQRFVGAELNHCSFHPEKARFSFGSNVGEFPCCNARAIRFDTSIRRVGCSSISHVIDSKHIDSPGKKNIEAIEARLKIIGEPFISECNYSENYKRILEEVNSSERNDLPNGKQIADTMPLNKIKESPPLIILLDKFISFIGDSLDELEEDDEEEKEGSEESLDMKFDRQSDGGSDSDDLSSRKKNGTGRKSRLKLKKKKRTVEMTPQKQKTYRVDSLRNEDRNQINTIIKKLLRNRVDEKLNIKKLEKKEEAKKDPAKKGIVPNGNNTGKKSVYRPITAPQNMRKTFKFKGRNKR